MNSLTVRQPKITYAVREGYILQIGTAATTLSLTDVVVEEALVLPFRPKSETPPDD